MENNKYRAWDIKDKRMITHTQDFIPLLVTNIGVFRLSATHEENLYSLVNKEFKLMKYSELQDNNGIEIYDGDIVDGSKYPDESCPSVIIFEDGAFRRKYKEWDDSLSNPIINNFELSILNDVVIGNIYENPELLNDASTLEGIK